MKYKFSEGSLKELNSCHHDLQVIMHQLIEIMDVKVLRGYRNEEDQNRAYDAGFSKLKYPKSKHNQNPSIAVDVVPYPIEWQNKKRFYFMAGIVKAIAESKGIQIRWGGDWNMNNNFDDQNFLDLPHFELAFLNGKLGI